MSFYLIYHCQICFIKEIANLILNTHSKVDCNCLTDAHSHLPAKRINECLQLFLKKRLQETTER